MGMFDDLIPQQNSSLALGGQPPPAIANQPAQTRGLFDDLIPGRQAATQAAPVPDLSHIDDETQLMGELNKIPAEQRQPALDKWATGRVALDRTANAGTGQRISDAVGRVSGMVPVLGGLTDEADAALHSLGGGNYDVQLAYSRARQKAQNEAQTPKLATLPYIGDVYESGLEKAAGGVGGAVALPFANVMRGSGAIPGAVNAMTNAVPYAAADAFTRGEGGAGNRAEAAAKTIPDAAIDSAVLGGTLGKIQRQFDPALNAPAATGITGPNRNAVVEAANRQGVTLPDFLATDSPTKRAVAGFMASQPLTSLIVRNAADDAAIGSGNALRRVSDEYSNAGTGITAGAIDPTAAAGAAGHQASDAMQHWIEHDSSNHLTGLYNGVFNRVNPNNTYPIADTRRAVVDLMRQSQVNATPTGMQIANRLDDALSRVQGMSVEGIKGLRTYVGNLLNDTILPEAGTIQPGLNRVYGSLTDDLRFALRREGGQRLVNDWEDANNTAREFSEQRQNLTKIIGTDASASPERIVDRLISMAGTKGGADMNQLLLAQAATNHAAPNVWNEVSAAAVRRLGQGNASQVGSPGTTRGFSPDAFLTGWNRLSENGKNALFGGSAAGSLRNSLDDIATISDRFRDIRRFQNPSGTAQVAGATSLLAQLGTALAGHPLAAASAVAQVAGSGVLSWLLSRPAGAHVVSNFGRNYYNYSTGQAGQAAMKLATIMLAKQVSDHTGEDEKDVANRLNGMTGVR